MSLAAVTKDKLEKKRLRTLGEESRIVKIGLRKHWRKSDATGVLFIERVIGLAFFPVLLFWALLVFCLASALGTCLLIFNLISSTLRSSK
ncbi:MAG: hypothetical protein KA436_12680 [Oligoflexales bacterium]|nr:hypothetical protein [Oligoflexales bacterium]